ncbi:nitroreductase family protein [Melissococcus plutonius]|uniref:Nitroreductase n=1 Tax=Melissococcus plutonius (strain ATCC 35311 / DSM 29964 / CIP 104052 / LMG 20360 / NCIMB 702443) TaxID=940190 RepID=F3Y7X9_MELPT|nr:nitroreductase family protein [Melissococcus plutonius]AIM24363.1 putative NAD(P)H nitroreductase YdgI [Melissococcus plutonius S1]KMT25752.1 putative NAD(P)H nitroreductase YdgI [Melissococcus plutonius]KMT27097.1 putative NAD(P)H nitroreductase YdgI [Melissococcus plutonius]KMT28198.1 putative NAD(P)H nitroreductase YdgI [Melissococcus plutonius]KMT29935.1 putative NAD(P)H nitroreductase YdgI [Melissococcus plutonius]
MEKPVTNDFAKIVFERRSIREFDKNVKIDKQELLEIIQKATAAPSSVNMQSWRFVVVESDAGKEKLRPLIGPNIKQNDTSSAMILIFGDMECYKYGERICDQAYKEGKMSKEEKNKGLETFIPYYENLSKQEMNDIVKIDSSLAAMQLMLVARSYGYDTNPIGYFQADQLAETFDLNKDRYMPVLILAIGKAVEEGHPSFRLPAEEITYFK